VVGTAEIAGRGHFAERQARTAVDAEILEGDGAAFGGPVEDDVLVHQPEPREPLTDLARPGDRVEVLGELPCLHADRI